MGNLRCSGCQKVFSVPDGLESKVLALCGGKCDTCHGELKIEAVDADWMGKIYTDENLWYTKGFESFPAIIAHEYWRLREMFHERKPYGVYFQIRDVMESVLKYEVLVICAWANAKAPGFQEQVGCKITTDGMTLGAWHELARRILVYFDKSTLGEEYRLPDALWAGLRIVVNRYGNLVSWRNAKIGHGALGFEEDEQFKSDIRGMIECFKQLFEEKSKKKDTQTASMTLGEALMEQTLWLEDTELTGHSIIRELQGRTGELRVNIQGAEACFSVEPYIVMSDGGIFFFDNQRKEHVTQRQCYNDGRRFNRDVPFFTELLRLNTAADLSNDVAGPMRIRAEDDLLNQMLAASEFTKPEHLIAWLKDLLSKYEKGVFLLKMPRGSGKSSFSQKLNRLYRNPWVLFEDVDVRTYHVSRTQMISETDFPRQIEEQWRHDYENRTEWMGYTPIRDLISKGMTQSEALADYLEACQAFTRQVRNRARILLVIDGLDEIANEKLWGYIPSPEQLSEGVYIALTSRDPEHEVLPKATADRISKIDITETLSVYMDEKGNGAFLKSYMNAHIDSKVRTMLSGEDIETMARLAEYRVLNLGMLCKLVNAGVSVSALPDASQVVNNYLELLEASYGEKEKRRLWELLSVLSTIGAEEALSLKELALLLDNGRVSLALLGRMRDLEPLLTIQRGSYGDKVNRYAPVNQSVADAIMNYLPDRESFMNSLVKDALEIVFDSTVIDSLNTLILYDEYDILCDEDEGVDDDYVDYALLVLAHLKACAGTKHEDNLCLKGMDADQLRKIFTFLSSIERLYTYSFFRIDRTERALRALSDELCNTDLEGESLELEKNVLDSLLRISVYNWYDIFDKADALEKSKKPERAIKLLEMVDTRIIDRLGGSINEGQRKWHCRKICHLYVSLSQWQNCMVFIESIPESDHSILDIFCYYAHLCAIKMRSYYLNPTMVDFLKQYFVCIDAFENRINAARLEQRAEDAATLKYYLSKILFNGWEENWFGGYPEETIDDFVYISVDPTEYEESKWELYSKWDKYILGEMKDFILSAMSNRSSNLTVDLLSILITHIKDILSRDKDTDFEWYPEFIYLDIDCLFATCPDHEAELFNELLHSTNLTDYYRYITYTKLFRLYFDRQEYNRASELLQRKAINDNLLTPDQIIKLHSTARDLYKESGMRDRAENTIARAMDYMDRATDYSAVLRYRLLKQWGKEDASSWTRAKDETDSSFEQIQPEINKWHNGQYRGSNILEKLSREHILTELVKIGNNYLILGCGLQAKGIFELIENTVAEYRSENCRLLHGRERKLLMQIDDLRAKISDAGL